MLRSVFHCFYETKGIERSGEDLKGRDRYWGGHISNPLKSHKDGSLRITGRTKLREQDRRRVSRTRFQCPTDLSCGSTGGTPCGGVSATQSGSVRCRRQRYSETPHLRRITRHNRSVTCRRRLAFFGYVLRLHVRGERWRKK